MDQHAVYMETGSQNAYYNLAFEDYILQTHRSEDHLLLWQNENTIVIGLNQNADEEINKRFVETHRTRVVRRMTGGGAVYHDLGNLNYSFITDAGRAEQIAMQCFTEPVVRALKKLGLQAENSGRNDILVEGKKVSGTAQRLLNGRILHHGTLLFDSDPSMISEALNVDPSKYISKSSKSVRERVGNIRDFLKEDMTLAQFWTYLKNELAGANFVQKTLTQEERRAVETLVREKYCTWDWNFGKTPLFQFKNRRRWDCGLLEVGLSVEYGTISEIAFFGDFLSRQTPGDIAAALIGCVYQRASVAQVLDKFVLEQYFGGILKDEILDTLFDC